MNAEVTTWERLFLTVYIQSLPPNTLTLRDVRLGMKLLDMLEFDEQERLDLGITLGSEAFMLRMPLNVVDIKHALQLDNDALRWLLGIMLAPDAKGFAVSQEMLCLEDKMNAWKEELARSESVSS